MAAPSILVIDNKGAGSARVGILRGGLYLEWIGPALPTGKSNTAGTPLMYRNCAMRYKGRLYAITQATVHSYDPDTNTWPVIYSTNTPASPYDRGTHGGLIEFMRSSRTDTGLGFWARNGGNTYSFWRTYLGLTGWGSTEGPVISTTVQACAAIDFGGNVYGRGSPGNGAITAVYDSASHTVAGQNFIGSPARYSGAFFTVDDRLFYVAPESGSGGYAANFVEELILGTWVAQLTGSVRFGTLATGSDFGAVSAMKVGEEAFVFGPYAAGATAANGLACLRFYVATPGGAISVQDVSDPVVPAAIRHGGATIGNIDCYRCTCFVDNETDPANPSGYLMFQPGALAEAVTLFQFNGAAAEMTVVGTPQADGDFAFAHNCYGGGNVLNGIAGSTPLVTGRVKEANKGVVGLELVYELRGDQTRLDHGTVTSGPFTVGETVTAPGGFSGTVDYVGTTGLYLLIDHSASGVPVGGEVITGGSSGASATLEIVLRHGQVTSGPYEVGESILGGTSGATAVITAVGLGLIKVDTVASGPFQPSETITQTTGTNSGAVSITTSAAPEGHTGGAADKTVQFRYYLGPNDEGQGVPDTGLCTLVPGTVQGGGTLQAANTQLTGIAADNLERNSTPVIARSVEWDFLTDGIPEGLVTRIQLEAIRP